MAMRDVLVANRGEIAVRVIRAIHGCGGRAVAICPQDDDDSPHVRLADDVVLLPGVGVAAYLDGAAVIEAAVRSGCSAIHPGYGFLSENAAFAADCLAHRLTFVGPSPKTLELLGDKSRARAFATNNGVATLPGTDGPTSLAAAREFAEAHGPVMLKALAGGGGRGMRAVTDPAALPEAFDRCTSEARQSFGNGDLYVERLALHPRHIEIQVVGDGIDVQHLYERDCSVQRRHQKLVEIAPSPSLSVPLRERIIESALALARTLGYTGLGTFEFLVDGDDYFFMEANPRLQVEHTVTEEVTGVDLVRTQLQIAGGATLADVGLTVPPRLQGFAVQARVNLETMAADGAPQPSSGTIGAFVLPSGPGVRVDTYGVPGYRVSPRYDSLIAKVIGRGQDFADAAARTAGALAEFVITGVPTNLDLLHGIVTDPDFTDGELTTDFIPTHLAGLIEHRRPTDALAVEAVTPTTAARVEPADVPVGAVTVAAPMSGVVVDVPCATGDVVVEGGVIAVLEAMKMEHLVRAARGVRLDQVMVKAGQLVESGQLLAFGEPADGAESDAEVSATDEDWSNEVAEIYRRRELALGMGGPAKVERQCSAGKLNARERIDALADPGTFREAGPLTAFVDYDDDGTATRIQPANFVTGTAEIDGRRVVLGVDDFTIRAGSGDAAIHRKQVWMEYYARDVRLPLVRLLDGASGGGSVKMAQEMGYTYVPELPGWDGIVDMLSVVPVVAAAVGPTVGLGAARLVMSHFTLMVDGIGQLFTAGPPLVLAGTGEDLTKEELGGSHVHATNGAIDRVVASEAAAFDAIRAFLSYLPSSVYQIPPVIDSADPVDRRDDLLLSAVPRNRKHPYAIWPVLDAIFDAGSVFPYTEYGGGTVTALARLDGHPVGIIASDPMQGATMSTQGAKAIERLVDLCETFHLPLVSITDQAGVGIGLAAERSGAIRAGARAITAIYQMRVPQAEVITRRVFGVGGAGMVNRHRTSRSWSWPSGDWGSLPPKGGIEAAFRALLEASEDPDAAVAAIAAELAKITSPFRTAEHFGVQDLIDPRETRALLCDWVHDAYRVLPELIGPPSFGTRP